MSTLLSNPVFNIILSILVFNIIIIVHELGHFIVAKLCDIKVHEFSLFIGPKLFSFNIGETMYSIRTIPALAYVKLEGEDEPSDSEHSYSNKPLLARMAVIAAGPVANILLATVFLMVFYLNVGYNTNNLKEVPEGSPAYLAGLRQGDSLVSYDNKKVYDPMDAMLFMVASKGKSADVSVVRNGQRIDNLTIKPIVVPKNTYILGFSPKEGYGKDSTVINTFGKNAPIEKAGAQIGDKIIKLNTQSVSTMVELRDYLYNNKTNPIDVKLIRDGQELTLKGVTPVQSNNSEMYDMGVSFITNVKGSLLDTTKQAFISTYSTVRQSVYSIVWLIQGKFSPKEMAGPVGIVSAMNSVVEHQVTFYEKLMGLVSLGAFISVGLGIANLLPIPPADGSKLVLLTVEAVRRKPLPQEKEAYIMMAGFVFMMIIFVLLLFNDIARLIPG